MSILDALSPIPGYEPPQKRKYEHYDFESLEIGGSLTMKANRNTAYARAFRAGQKLGRKFQVRDQVDCYLITRIE